MKVNFDGQTLLASKNAINAYGAAFMFTITPIEKQGVTVKNIDGVNVIV